MTNRSQGQSARSLSLSEIKNLLLQSSRDVDHGALQHIESRIESSRISESGAGIIYIDFDHWLEQFLQNLFSQAEVSTDSAATILESKPEKRQSSVS